MIYEYELRCLGSIYYSAQVGVAMLCVDFVENYVLPKRTCPPHRMRVMVSDKRMKDSMKIRFYSENRRLKWKYKKHSGDLYAGVQWEIKRLFGIDTEYLYFTFKPL